MSDSRDPIELLERQGYKADSDALRGIGQLSVGAERLKTTCGTTYIRTLITYALSSATKSDDDAGAIGESHNALYPYIVEGVTTDDVKPELASSRADKKARALERNARSNFARTAYYTVGRFIHEGGRLADIDVPNATKATLTAAADEMAKARAEAAAVVTPAVRPSVQASAMDDINAAYNTLMSAIARHPRNTPGDKAILDSSIEAIATALTAARDTI